MMDVVVITGAIRCAKLQPNRHHQQTNTQLFTGWMPFLSPNQQCQRALKGKYATKYTCKTNNSLLLTYKLIQLIQKIYLKWKMVIVWQTYLRATRFLFHWFFQFFTTLTKLRPTSRL